MKLDHDFLDRLETYGPPARSLSMCLRPTFCAEHEDTQMVWGDWSAIEARKLPWLANSRGSNAVLDVFRQVDADPDAPDIYMIEAGNYHGIDPAEINGRILEGKKKQYLNNTALQTAAKEAKGWRQEGKVMVLSLGFGGGIGALMAMAVNYGLHYDEKTAERIVNVWRENNPWARRFWDELKEAFFAAYENPGNEFFAGRITYIYDPDYHGGTTFCILPCGRILSYPNLHYREVERTDRVTGDTYTVKTLTYRKGYTWGAIWHGILAENPTQASAASLLRATLKDIDIDMERDFAAGYEPLFTVRGHTHDEIIGECHVDDVAAARAYLKEKMEKQRSWTEGLPLVAEVTDHWHYTKAMD